jgi:bacterioferritin
MEKSILIIRELKRGYAMELEMVENYLAISIDLDGAAAEEIRVSLGAKVADKLGHARRLGKRIKALGGRVPGSLELPRVQNVLQPPVDSHDSGAVIFGVLRAEEETIAHYKRVIGICDGIDSVTQDLMIQLLSDDQEHHRQFNRIAERMLPPGCPTPFQS